MDEKVFRDPVHNFIYVRNDIIMKLINSREMQRLRRIRQLGTSYITYHGAEHSRFAHSLGTYEIMRKVISTFNRNNYEQWDNENELLCLCAALLHDIGHGPFSHAIEKVLKKDHETWTQEIILGDTEVNKILKSINDEFPQKVADVIGKTYPDKIVVSLISSQLDADRMDYLLRDCNATGVDYGKFDLERMLRILYPYNKSIVIKENGVHCAEEYILARYFMYWQVYFHETTRSAEVILKKIFLRLEFLYNSGQSKKEFKNTPETIKSLLEKDMSLEDYIELDESTMFFCFKQWVKSKDKILSDLCYRFLNRKLFKCVDCKDSFIKNPMFPHEIAKLFQEADIDPEYYFCVDTPVNVSYDYYRPGEVEETTPINILTNDDKIIELSRISKPVRALTGEKQVEHRMYFPLDMLDKENPKHKKIMEYLEVV